MSVRRVCNCSFAAIHLPEMRFDITTNIRIIHSFPFSFMAIATEPQETSGTDTLATLHERLSQEMQRHVDAVAEIQRKIQDATRKEAESLLEGDDSAAAAKVPESSGPVAEQKRELTVEQKEKLLTTLKHRLSQKANHYERPEGINFADVQRALDANPAALWSLSRMEETGGAPDIVAVEHDTFVFADCSEESPAGRRDCVYDKAAEKSVSGTFNGNAVDAAEGFGVEMWSPEFYRQMQTSGKFDRNTWSWLKTDAETRSTGGAMSGRRYGDFVNVDKNDARGHRDRRAWRGLLRVQKVS